MNLDRLSIKLHETAVEKGFWTEQSGENQVNQILAKMMLINTEVSELADAYVKQMGSENIKKEAVDVLIRLLDLVQAMKEYQIIDGEITETLKNKMKFNKTRPKKHNRLM